MSGDLPYILAMNKHSAIRTDRIEARVSSDMRRRLKRAADAEGRSLSDFVVAAAAEAANRTLAQAEVLRLSEEAQLAFARALIDAPAPTDSLRQAAARHKARFGA